MKGLFISAILIITVPYSGYSQNWDSLKGGIDYWANCLFADSSYLYVGQGKQNAKDNALAVIVEFQGDIYVGGGGTKGVYKWDGLNWSAPGGGVNSVVFQLYEFNSELYAVGWFDSAGAVPADKIAKWDGTVWSSIDTTIWINPISCIIDYQGDIYIGGNMVNWNGSMRGIARWDGVKWQSVSGGIGGSMGGLNCFEVYQNELYAGGLFSKASGNPGDGIARWNGTSWNDVGGGFPIWPSLIWDLETIDNKLYAVGGFDIAGGIPANDIAVWDATNWCSLGSQFSNSIGAITTFKDSIYIAGGFWTIDGDSILRIAKWTGGSFTDTCGVISGITEVRDNSIEVVIYPNPFSETATISTDVQGDLLFSLYDLLGREVMRIKEERSNSIVISRGVLPSGVYFYRLRTSEIILATGKLVIE